MDDDQLKAEIKEQLMDLTRAPRRGSKADSPMEHLKKCCPTLLGLMPAVLTSIGANCVDIEDFTKALFEEVALKSKAVEVQQAGDLLGLTADEVVNVRQVFDDYRTTHPSDTPAQYFRFGRKVRQIIAAHRDGLDNSLTWNANFESGWMKDLVNELCTYLDNKDGELTKVVVAYNRKHLPTGETDAKTELIGTVEPQHSTRNIEPPIKGTHYVDRAEIETQFDALVGQGAKLIAFVGQAGMGKTTAAKVFAAKYSSRPPAPLIRFIDGQIFTEDLRVALQRHGITAPHTTQDNAQENLVRLISAEDAPEFVILDNFENLDQVAALLPYHTQSRIVATCRVTGKTAPSKFDVITVSKMTNGEARAMAMKRIPSLSSADASDIAEVLDGYPLAISHACGLITGAHVRVKDLCRELSRKPHGITEKNKEQRTLYEILSRTVIALRDENQLALELLTLMILPGPFMFKPQLRIYPEGLVYMQRTDEGAEHGHFGRLEYVLRMYVAAKPDCLDYAELNYARAVDTLRRYNLIDIEPVSHDLMLEELGAIVSVHTLTGIVLFRLLREYVSMVHNMTALAIQLHSRSPAPVAAWAIKYGYLRKIFEQAARSDADISGDKKDRDRHRKQINEVHYDFYNHLTKLSGRTGGHFRIGHE